jgi:hypothetical protein
VIEAEYMGLRFLDTFRWSTDYNINHDVCISGGTNDIVCMGIHITFPGNIRRARISRLLDGALRLYILLPHGSDI